jgi:peptidoglycan L-alanyl-D-glutamate endopeptidase CwlK
VTNPTLFNGCCFCRKEPQNHLRRNYGFFSIQKLKAKSTIIFINVKNHVPAGKLEVMKIQQLIPEVRPLFEAFLLSLDKNGLKYSVLETLRTIEVQEAYYAQGRKPLVEINELRKKAGLYLLGEDEGKKIITKTMRSVHLTGRAADIVPVINGKIPWNITADNAELWLDFGRLGQEAGLEWGGEWKPLNQFGIGWDAPHYQKL